MAKDSVKKRLGEESKSGMSFCEFSYQLLQGYDYLYLYKHKNCKLQMGGSDQWGNITTGTELIRRKESAEAFAITCPLITKADGTKFGKTESGNVWLDPKLTTPYKFYQFWLNVSDEDAERYIKIFTMLPKEEIDTMIIAHREAPHARELQKVLAREVTIMCHSEGDYSAAVDASQILFGKGTAETLANLDKETFLSIFEGVPLFEIERSVLTTGINVVELLATNTQVFENKSEVRRMIQGGGLSINKNKIESADSIINASGLIKDEYLLIQKGKKNYYIIRIK